MVGQFDSVISGALGSVTDMFSLFDTITNMTVILEDLENLPIAGELTLGGVERYRFLPLIPVTLSNYKYKYIQLSVSG